jgi:hypothetical protein
MARYRKHSPAPVLSSLPKKGDSPPPLGPGKTDFPKLPRSGERKRPKSHEMGFFRGLSNSMWIIWTLSFGVLSWLSFFYIGFRTNNKRWVTWGFFYMIPFLMMVIFGEFLPIMAALGALLALPVGMVSMIHALAVRGEYLERLSALERDELLLSPLPISSPEILLSEVAQKTEPPAQPIDPNNDPPEKLARIPGFNAEAAMKVVLIREMTGYFESLEDFGRAMGLLPEELAVIRPHLILLPPEPSGREASPADSRRRDFA